MLSACKLRCAIGAVLVTGLVSGCGTQVAEYAAPAGGVPLTLAAVITSPPGEAVSVAPLIAAETGRCQFAEPQIIVAQAREAVTAVTAGRTYQLTGAFTRRFALRTSQITDDQVFTARAGRSYRAEFTYLPTGYAVRVFEDGVLLPEAAACG